MELVNEVVPLCCLREVEVVMSPRLWRAPTEETVREALVPFVGNPDRCVVTVRSEGDR